jgi:hypothetical protein
LRFFYAHFRESLLLPIGASANSGRLSFPVLLQR